MKIRGNPGRYEFHLETDREKAIFGKAFRECEDYFESLHDAEKRGLLYWGDAELDGTFTTAFIAATWDSRDYPLSESDTEQLPVVD